MSISTAVTTPGGRAMRLTVPTLTPAEQRDAATMVARRAVDAVELRELLDALGLDPAALRTARSGGAS